MSSLYSGPRRLLAGAALAAVLPMSVSTSGAQARPSAARGCRPGFVLRRGHCRARVFQFQIVFTGSVSESETYSGGAGVQIQGSDSFAARFKLVWSRARFTANRHTFADNRCGGSTRCNNGTLDNFTSTRRDEDPNVIDDFSCNRHGVAATFHENTSLAFNVPVSPEEPSPLVPSVHITGGAPNLTFDMPAACREVTTDKETGSTRTDQHDARYTIGEQNFACRFDSIPAAAVIDPDFFVPIRRLISRRRISVRVGRKLSGSGPCSLPGQVGVSGSGSYRWSGTIVLTRVR
jgi:hypothetical protein